MCIAKSTLKWCGIIFEKKTMFAFEAVDWAWQIFYSTHFSTIYFNAISYWHLVFAHQNRHICVILSTERIFRFIFFQSSVNVNAAIHSDSVSCSNAFRLNLHSIQFRCEFVFIHESSTHIHAYMHTKRHRQLTSSRKQLKSHSIDIDL